MKSITNRLFVVAAVALSLGTVAYGQTTLKADVCRSHSQFPAHPPTPDNTQSSLRTLRVARSFRSATVNRAAPC